MEVGLKQNRIMLNSEIFNMQGSCQLTDDAPDSSVGTATSTQHYYMTGDLTDHLPLYHKWLHLLQDISINRV